MKAAFYVNLDILSIKRISKYDAIVAIGILPIAIWAVCTYSVSMDEAYSQFARAGLALSYAGVLAGVFGHLSKQIKAADEFGRKIFAKAIAGAGLTTILIVCGLTLIWLAFDMEEPAMLSIYAPVFFLTSTWMRSRKIARSC